MNKEEKIEIMRQRHLAILAQARRYYQYQMSRIQEDTDYKPTGILSDEFEEWKVLDEERTYSF